MRSRDSYKGGIPAFLSTRPVDLRVVDLRIVDLRIGVQCAAFLAALSLLATPGTSQAQPVDSFGMGSRSVAMAGAVSADVKDFSANYYNPAGLAATDQLRLGLGYFRAHPNMEINGRSSHLDPVSGVMFGLIAPGKIGGTRFAFGLGAHLPDRRLARVRTLPRLQPRWEFYDNRPHRVFVGINTAVSPWPWLSIGAGMGFLAGSTNVLTIKGELDVIEADKGTNLEHGINTDIETVRYPLLGVQFHPHDDLSVGVSYRGAYALPGILVADFDADFVSSFIDPFDGILAVENVSTSLYSPTQLSVGTSIQTSDRLRVSAEVTWYDWSKYVGPIGSSDVILEIDLPDDLANIVEVPDEIAPGRPIDANFRDRFVPRLGLEYLAHRNDNIDIQTRLGWFYEKSPAPAQTGAANLIDGDRHVASVGGGIRWKDLEPWVKGYVTLDAHFQLSVLPERIHTKDSLTDPFGDLVAQGTIMAGGLTMEVGFD